MRSLILTAMQEIRNNNTADTLFHESNNYANAIEAVASISLSTTGGINNLVNSSSDMSTIANSQTAVEQLVASQTAMQEVADSQTAMQEVADSQTALDLIGNNAIVANTVYNNNTAISALNSSALIENVSESVGLGSNKQLRDDRTILLSHSTGSTGSRSNSPVFSNDSNLFPQTADQILRNTNRSQFTNEQTTTSATFIDISG